MMSTEVWIQNTLAEIMLFIAFCALLIIVVGLLISMNRGDE